MRTLTHGIHHIDDNESMSELIFMVEDSPEGGYLARAVGESIFTEGETLEELRVMVLDAVRCHFDAENMPSLVHLRFVREETIAV